MKNIKKDCQFSYRNVEYANLELGLDMALDGKAVFVGDRDTCLTYLHRKGYAAERRCTLSRVFLGLEYQRVLVFRSDFSYKERLNSKLLVFFFFY